MAKGQQRDPKLEVYWRGVLGRFSKSGLSVRGFCRREKVSEPTFYAWRRVIRQRDGEPKREAPAFVPVVVCDEPAVHDAAIIIEWPCGRTLRVPATIAADRLAELVRAVEAVAVAEVRA